jgi:excisionase family DNA binding protein
MLVLVELNINQAAAYLNCSVDTIRRRIKSGQLQARLDERGRYMISFLGGEPEAADRSPTQIVASEPLRRERQGSLEVSPDDWFETWQQPERRAAAPPATAPPVPPPPAVPPAPVWPLHEEQMPAAAAPAPPPSPSEPQPTPPDFESLRPADVPVRQFESQLPPQRRSTDPGLNEQIARLREERQELIQELQMWRDEAMAAKVALEELRRLIPQTLGSSHDRDSRAGWFRRK